MILKPLTLAQIDPAYTVVLGYGNENQPTWAIPSRVLLAQANQILADHQHDQDGHPYWHASDARPGWAVLSRHDDECDLEPGDRQGEADDVCGCRGVLHGADLEFFVHVAHRHTPGAIPVTFIDVHAADDQYDTPHLCGDQDCRRALPTAVGFGGER